MGEHIISWVTIIHDVRKEEIANETWQHSQLSNKKYPPARIKIIVHAFRCRYLRSDKITFFISAMYCIIFRSLYPQLTKYARVSLVLVRMSSHRANNIKDIVGTRLYFCYHTLTLRTLKGQKERPILPQKRTPMTYQIMRTPICLTGLLQNLTCGFILSELTHVGDTSHKTSCTRSSPHHTNTYTS